MSRDAIMDACSGGDARSLRPQHRRARLAHPRRHRGRSQTPRRVLTSAAPATFSRAPGRATAREEAPLPADLPRTGDGARPVRPRAARRWCGGSRRADRDADRSSTAWPNSSASRCRPTAPLDAQQGALERLVVQVGRTTSRCFDADGAADRERRRRCRSQPDDFRAGPRHRALGRPRDAGRCSLCPTGAGSSPTARTTTTVRSARC